MVDMADGSALSTDVGKTHPAQAQVCRSAPGRAGRAEPDYDYAVMSGTTCIPRFSITSIILLSHTFQLTFSNVFLVAILHLCSKLSLQAC